MNQLCLRLEALVGARSICRERCLDGFLDSVSHDSPVRRVNLSAAQQLMLFLTQKKKTTVLQILAYLYEECIEQGRRLMAVLCDNARRYFANSRYAFCFSCLSDDLLHIWLLSTAPMAVEWSWTRKKPVKMYSLFKEHVVFLTFQKKKKKYLKESSRIQCSKNLNFAWHLQKQVMPFVSFNV